MMFCKCIDACRGDKEEEEKKNDKENVIGGRGEEKMLGALCNIKSTLKHEKNCCDESNTKHSHSDNSLSNSSQE